jgi:hypothetical protein
MFFFRIDLSMKIWTAYVNVYFDINKGKILLALRPAMSKCGLVYYLDERTRAIREVLVNICAVCEIITERLV